MASFPTNAEGSVLGRGTFGIYPRVKGRDVLGLLLGAPPGLWQADSAIAFYLSAFLLLSFKKIVCKHEDELKWIFSQECHNPFRGVGAGCSSEGQQEQSLG